MPGARIPSPVRGEGARLGRWRDRGHKAHQFWPRLRGRTAFGFSIPFFSYLVMPDVIRHLGWQALWFAGKRYRVPLWTPGLCPG